MLSLNGIIREALSDKKGLGVIENRVISIKQFCFLNAHEATPGIASVVWKGWNT